MKAPGKVGIALLALAVGLTSGCAKRHTAKEVFYLIGSNMALPYWQNIALGFHQAAAEYKVTARVDGPENRDPKAELAALQKAIAAKPAGILISVSDEALLQPGIDQAVAAGIPVITVDSDAASSKRLYFIGTNNMEAGRMGARRLVEKLKGKGNVVFFTLSGQPNEEERLKGFKAVLDAYPNIKVMDAINIRGNASLVFDETEEMLALTGPKKIDAFVSLESASGVEVAGALDRNHVKDRIAIAWDSNPDTLNGIKSGTIDATVAQKPYAMGFVGLKALDEVFHNPPAHLDKDFAADAFSPYPEFVDTGTALVDKNNVGMYFPEGK